MSQTGILLRIVRAEHVKGKERNSETDQHLSTQEEDVHRLNVCMYVCVCVCERERESRVCARE